MRIKTAALILPCLLTACLPPAFAGYLVQTRLDSTDETHRYTWTVHNEDQSSGLNQFVVEVPANLRILDHTLPAPFQNPDGSAKWIMSESYTAQVDAHDSREWLPAPRRNMKWLMWGGVQPASCYPGGTSVTFSITTDHSLKPGRLRTVAVTYTPQYDPHYYRPFSGVVLGPVGDHAQLNKSHLTEGLLAEPVRLDEKELRLWPNGRDLD
jgi:hypothetical protein